MPGRIFISYSKEEPEPTKQLAEFLTSKGYEVWWDTNLRAGEVFRAVIDHELDAADAVIVIWTPHSVSSNWVISEADHGNRKHKLIPLRTREIETWRVPKPYDTYHINLVDDEAAILTAVQRLAGVPVQAPPPAPSTPGPGLSERSIQEALALEYWQAIKTSADPVGVRAFIADYGATGCGRLARDLLQRLEDAAWARLPRRRPAATLEEFLAQGWEGTKAALARAELEHLQRAGADRQAAAESARAGAAVGVQPPSTTTRQATAIWNVPAVVLPIAGVLIPLTLFVSGLWTLGNPIPAISSALLFGLAFWHYGKVGMVGSLIAAAVLAVGHAALSTAAVSINRAIFVDIIDSSTRTILLQAVGFVSALASAAGIMAAAAALKPSFRRPAYWAIALTAWPIVTVVLSFLASALVASGYDRSLVPTYFFMVYLCRQCVMWVCIGYWLAPATRTA